MRKISNKIDLYLVLSVALQFAVLVVIAFSLAGCTQKEIVYKDRIVEVVKTEGCKVPKPLLCTINNAETYTNIIDDMDLCIQELISIINMCKLKDIESKAPK